MKKCIIEYFERVKIYKIVILNVILSIIASYPIMLASLFIFGLFVNPSLIERIIGFIILITTVLLIIFFNYLLYKTNKKKVKNKRVELYIFVTLLVVILLAGSFFIFPSVWLNVWSFVF